MSPACDIYGLQKRIAKARKRKKNPTRKGFAVIAWLTALEHWRESLKSFTLFVDLGGYAAPRGRVENGKQ